MLLSQWLEIVSGWQLAFAQRRLWRRSVAQALASLVAVGRRTLSRSICARGRQHLDWSAEYKLHARSQWNVNDLFQSVLARALPLCATPYIAVAIDDTRLRKTGRHIQTAFFQRDPLSPKFRFNLMWGLRFLQVSLLVPLYRTQSTASPRGLPLRFVECPALKRPARKADPQQWQAYRQLCRRENLSQRAVKVLQELRQALDRAGVPSRPLLVVGDNSFCNRALMGAVFERTQLVVRARRDIQLCHRAADSGPCFYGRDRFTPESVRTDEGRPWGTAEIFHGGQWRLIRYKQVSDVYWQSAAKRRPLRLLVVGSIPYQVPSRRRLHYHEAAFLLTTDLTTPACNLLQVYFDRWQIEVNHREEKDTLGVGQAQLRTKASVARQPAFVVAAYSALLLAGLLAYGPERSSQFAPLPKWRRRATRPSCLDLVTVLRRQIEEQRSSLAPFGFHSSLKLLTLNADA